MSALIDLPIARLFGEQGRPGFMGDFAWHNKEALFIEFNDGEMFTDMAHIGQIGQHCPIWAGDRSVVASILERLHGASAKRGPRAFALTQTIVSLCRSRTMLR